jgi:putative FmdB family regulatory protein
MPIYEYVCEKDGSVIELLRPMADADKPVEDPLGKGREFKRQHSTFAKGGAGATAAGAKAGGGGGGCCPCGKSHGGCGAG